MMIRPIAFITAALLTVGQSAAWAVEIKNVRSGQEGKRAYLQYDLTGWPGEKEADVTVSIEISGKRYGSNQLNLSGDLGTKVKVGIGKRIWWDLLKDMPAGFDGEVVWTLDALLASEQKVQSEERERKQQKPTTPSLTGFPAQPAKQELQLEQTRPSAHSIMSDESVFTSLASAVIDKSHNLMWAKLGADTTEKFNYSRAVGYVRKMNQDKFAGFDNWRLPDDEDVSKLFASVAILSRKNGKAPMKVLLRYFPNLENWHYWQNHMTSRKLGKGPRYKRSFDIEDGALTGDLEDDELCILPVRTAASHPQASVKEPAQ